MTVMTHAPKKALTAALSGVFGLGMVIGVPTPAEAAQVTKWDCRSYYAQHNRDTIRKDTWCTQMVSNTLFPIYGRVKTTTYFKGHLA